MINNIYSNGRYIQVHSGSASTYTNSYAGALGVGNLRFSITNQCIEVYDGTTWIRLNMPDAHIGLNSEAESLLDWAKQKRDDEQLMQTLMAKHPGLKEAYERLEIMKVLCLEEENK